MIYRTKPRDDTTVADDQDQDQHQHQHQHQHQRHEHAAGGGGAETGARGGMGGEAHAGLSGGLVLARLSLDVYYDNLTHQVTLNKTVTMIALN